jgi:hypothetical protein
VDDPPLPDEILSELHDFVRSADRSLQSIASFEVLTGLACVVGSLAKCGGDAGDPHERAIAFLEVMGVAMDELDPNRRDAAKAYFDIGTAQARARTLTERRYLAAKALGITPERFRRGRSSECEEPLLRAVADVLFQLDREARRRDADGGGGEERLQVGRLEPTESTIGTVTDTNLGDDVGKVGMATTADGRTAASELPVGRRGRRITIVIIIGAFVAIAGVAAVRAIMISRDGGGPSPPARVVLEAENAVTRDGLVRQRSLASGDATVLLESGQSLTLSLPRGLEGSYRAVIRYSNAQGRNDLPGEIVAVAGATTSDFEAMNTGDWNRFFKHGITLGLEPDRSTIRVSVSGGDRLGIEIDEVTLRRIEHD